MKECCRKRSDYKVFLSFHVSNEAVIDIAPVRFSLEHIYMIPFRISSLRRISSP